MARHGRFFIALAAADEAAADSGLWSRPEIGFDRIDTSKSQVRYNTG